MIGGLESVAGAAAARRATTRRRPRAVTLEEGAWIAAVPCALITIAAIIVLGPSVGRVFFAPGGDVFFPELQTIPHPIGRARYVLALLGPFLLAAAIAVLAGRRLRLTPPTIRALTWTSQLATFVFLLACLGAENDIVLHTYPAPQQPNPLFNLRTILTAVAVPTLLLLVLQSPRARDRLAAWTREDPIRRAAGMLVAAAVAALWLVTGVDSDGTVGYSLSRGWLQWPVNEAFAVLNGRTPLADFHAQYAHLSAYPTALAMQLFGATLLVCTIAMASVSWCAMVAVYATFRRVARSSLLALALFVPFVAVTFFVGAGTRTYRLSPASIFSLWPIRYAGPYLIAWLVGRHLDALRPRRASLLFVAAGLVMLNNPEFGIGALLGTLLALACKRSSHSRRGALRLLASAVGGLCGALALLALLTLVRAGELPHLGLLLEYPRVFGLGGWHAQPLRAFGFHVAAYVTYGAVIAVAAVRAARSDEDAVLTGLLAWSGGFGLIAGSYYVGESEPGSMLSLLSAWFFALALLVVVVCRRLAARGWRRPTLLELTVLFGFALSLNAIRDIPYPWLEASRLRAHAPPSLLKPLAVEQSIARQTRPGEHVVLFFLVSERIAHDVGVVNVSPYASAQGTPTRQMLRRAIDAIRAADVHKIFYDPEPIVTTGEQLAMLARAGFTPRGPGLLMDTPR
jgi:hypothetical protein